MDGIRQHKMMAATGKVDAQGGNFGVDPFNQVNGGGPTMSTPGGHDMPHGHNAKMMGDHERGIGKHIPRGKGSMGAQAHAGGVALAVLGAPIMVRTTITPRLACSRSSR